MAGAIEDVTVVHRYRPWVFGVASIVIYLALFSAGGWLLVSDWLPVLRHVIDGTWPYWWYQDLCLLSDLVAALVCGAVMARWIVHRVGWWLTVAVFLSLLLSFINLVRAYESADLSFYQITLGELMWIPGPFLLPLTYWVWRHVFGLGRMGVIVAMDR